MTFASNAPAVNSAKAEFQGVHVYINVLIVIIIVIIIILKNLK